MNGSHFDEDKAGPQKSADPSQVGEEGQSKREAVSLKPLANIPLQLSIELGKTSLRIRDLLEMKHHSVYELDAVAGGYLNICLNGVLMGKGEPLIADDKVRIRINEILDQNH
ncbi:MAG: FliM/FliN family flagellar motor switch protein [Terriglobia bacterium]